MTRMARASTAATDYDLVVRTSRLVGADGERAASVGVRDGAIATVAPLEADLGITREVVLADDEVLLPGLVDSHVHVNDPGRSEWEGYPSATRAAAAGGVTTIVDMPLNSIPPTVDETALRTKHKAAHGNCFVDTGFWGGAVPGNRPALRGLHEAGVFGFKCFLLPSGVDEFPPLEPGEFADAMAEIASFGGLMIVHAEDAELIDAAPQAHGARYQDFLASRPRAAEDRAVRRVIEQVRETGCRAHILHVSSADVVDLIAAAKQEGLPLTAETCPHYLVFTAEEIANGATEFKCCPPIREEANRDRLWQGLADGTIDMIVSDHSPSTPELKQLDSGDFATAWGGVSSLQLGLPAVWTEARARGFGLSDMVRWMCRGPARQTRMRTKGSIEVDYDADFCVFAPDDSQVIDPARLHHKHPVTPYAGRELAGAVRATWLRGELIDSTAHPRGRFLTRDEA